MSYYWSSIGDIKKERERMIYMIEDVINTAETKHEASAKGRPLSTSSIVTQLHPYI